MDIIVQFFSSLKVFQENPSLPLKMRYLELSNIAASPCVSIVTYSLLDCFTDPQTAKEIFDFAMKAINPQVNLACVNCSASMN